MFRSNNHDKKVRPVIWAPILGLVAVAVGSSVALAGGGNASGEAVDRSAERAEMIESESQIHALSDSIITKAEYESAIEDHLSCVTESGLEVVDAGIDWNGIVYDYSVLGDESAGMQIDNCYTEHAEAVDMAWQISVAPIRKAIEAEMLSCLQGEGLVIPEGAPDHPNVLKEFAPTDKWDSCRSDAQQIADADGFRLAPLRLPD